jgi:hypothetical protein
LPRILSALAKADDVTELGLEQARLAWETAEPSAAGLGAGGATAGPASDPCAGLRFEPPGGPREHPERSRFGPTTSNECVRVRRGVAATTDCRAYRESRTRSATDARNTRHRTGTAAALGRTAVV